MLCIVKSSFDGTCNDVCSLMFHSFVIGNCAVVFFVLEVVGSSFFVSFVLLYGFFL